MLKSYLLFIIIFTSSSCYGYNYKVEEKDTLSSILNSIWIYKDGDLTKSIKEHSKINRLKSKNLILKNQKLKLSPIFSQYELECNLIKRKNQIKLKKKFLTPQRGLCHNLQKLNISFFIGKETITLNEANKAFKGKLSTENLFSYSIEYNLNSHLDKLNLILTHSLFIQEYESLNTMSLNKKQFYLPSFGLVLKSNFGIINPVVSFSIDKELFPIETTPTLLSLEERQVERLGAGLDLRISKFSLNPMVERSNEDNGYSLKIKYDWKRWMDLKINAQRKNRRNSETVEKIFTGIGFKF